MKLVNANVIHHGAIFDVEEEWWNNGGDDYKREIVRKPGAVAILPYDREHYWLVGQPREAFGQEDYVEVAAGLRDVEGESPLSCAERELAEELGFRANRWARIAVIHTSPGFTDEEITIFAATDLEPCPRPAADDNTASFKYKRKHIGGRIETTKDAKTLLALLWLAQQAVKP